MIMISGDLLLLFHKCVNLLTSYKLTHSDSSQRGVPPPKLRPLRLHLVFVPGLPHVILIESSCGCSHTRRMHRHQDSSS